MDRDTSKNQLQQRMESGGLSLPTLPDGLESALLQ